MIGFRSNGKLLLTGEYLVLDGALALAVPTKQGQSLKIKSGHQRTLTWQSFDDNQMCWLEVAFELPTLRILSETFMSDSPGAGNSLALKLQEVLQIAQRENPEFLRTDNGFEVRSFLEFPRDWGLGSSSTLVNNVAQWAKINPFYLQFESFGGSAYDIACALSDSPIHYQLLDKEPSYDKANFDPSFKNQLFFVFLNQKQNSRDAIRNYRAINGVNQVLIDRVSELTSLLTSAKSLIDFEKIIREHEALVSSVVGQDPIQQTLFSDYFGQTKSLGAWGGDFILATGNDDSPNYFNSKGYDTVIPYQDMAL